MTEMTPCVDGPAIPIMKGASDAVPGGAKDVETLMNRRKSGWNPKAVYDWFPVVGGVWRMPDFAWLTPPMRRANTRWLVLNCVVTTRVSPSESHDCMSSSPSVPPPLFITLPQLTSV